jgi:hypothetical protein
MRSLFKTLLDCGTKALTRWLILTAVPGICPRFLAALAEVGLCSRIPTRPCIPSPLHMYCFSRGKTRVRGRGRGLSSGVLVLKNL